MYKSIQYTLFLSVYLQRPITKYFLQYICVLHIKYVQSFIICYKLIANTIPQLLKVQQYWL